MYEIHSKTLWVGQGKCAKYILKPCGWGRRDVKNTQCSLVGAMREMCKIYNKACVSVGVGVAMGVGGVGAVGAGGGTSVAVGVGIGVGIGVGAVGTGVGADVGSSPKIEF